MPLPAEVSEVMVESQYSQVRVAAERLPGRLADQAREAPRLVGAAVVEGASEEDTPRWGWSRLHVMGERRDALRRAFGGGEGQ